VRVEDEAKWILSYAYNVGIAAATQPIILKCDADCIPRAEVLALVPETSSFYAGNSKSGTPVNKTSVNGQCIFRKAQFEAVNGYSELIRTYGRDDEDFYDRLIAAGCARREIRPDLLDFIGHSDEARMANQFADGQTVLSVEQTIQRIPLYHEMYNGFLALNSTWGPGRARARYQEVRSEDRLTVLRRDPSTEIPVPIEIHRDARLFSLRYVAAQIANFPRKFTDRLDEQACLNLIVSRTKSLSANQPKSPARRGHSSRQPAMAR
jgi:hypothetical protein